MSLHEIHIQGFKSIRDQKPLFGPLNVFIGGNGSAKSNLVGIFHFLNRIANQQLQTYTGETGGANALLHFGRKQTWKMGLRIEFETRHTMSNIFEFELKPTDEDRFIFEKEVTYFWDKKSYSQPYRDDHWTGHVEAKIGESKKHIHDMFKDISTAIVYTTSTTQAPQQGSSKPVMCPTIASCGPTQVILQHFSTGSEKWTPIILRILNALFARPPLAFGALSLNRMP